MTKLAEAKDDMQALEPTTPIIHGVDGATATYCPEDNKLRLYLPYRVARSMFDAVRRAGYKWAPKQDLMVCPRWTPYAESVALTVAGAIDDEDMSPEERAADRAERFETYRDNRTDDAQGHADRFDSGPQAHGYQSQTRAERTAARHDRQASHAVNQWSKAEYWQRRTASVIQHALYKVRSDVRARRITTLEAEQRKRLRDRQENTTVAQQHWQVLSHFANGGSALAGVYVSHWTAKAFGYAADTSAESPYTIEQIANIQAHSAITTSSYTLTAAMQAIAKRLEQGVGTRAAAAGEALALRFPHGEPKPYTPEEDAWNLHYTLRLVYERQMLGCEVGELAANLGKIDAGGTICGHVIHKASKSKASGKYVSVFILGSSEGYSAESNYSERVRTPCLCKRELEDTAASKYQPPTPESLAKLAEERQALTGLDDKAKPCPFINPTLEDAQRLAALRLDRSHRGQPEAVMLTAAKFQWHSKEDSAGTVYLDAAGKASRGRQPSSVCRVRAIFRMLSTCPAHLTDKPAKPLPLDWPATVEAPAQVQP